MVKGRYVRMGIGLILAGAAFIALNLWFVSTFHLVPGRRGENVGLAIVGATMIIAGVMVLLGA